MGLDYLTVIPTGEHMDIVVPATLDALEPSMKNHLRFRHGRTEGEANSPLGMLLLTLMAIIFRLAPLIAAVGGYYVVDRF